MKHLVYYMSPLFYALFSLANNEDFCVCWLFKGFFDGVIWIYEGKLFINCELECGLLREGIFLEFWTSLLAKDARYEIFTGLKRWIIWTIRRENTFLLIWGPNSWSLMGFRTYRRVSNSPEMCQSFSSLKSAQFWSDKAQNV